MSLRNEVIALLLVLFGAYSVVEISIQRLVLYPSFVELEREEATRNVERAVQALQREIELLGPSASDWSRWDDTYAYVEDRNEDFAQENLNAEALQSLRVQLLGIYDLDGNRVWGLAPSADGEGEVDLGDLTGPALPVGYPLLAQVDDRGLKSGIVSSPAGPVLVVAHPILTSQGEGPARGTVLMGRLLDDEAVTRLAAQSRIDLRVEPPEEISGAAEEAVLTAASAAGMRHSPIRLVEGPEATTGATVVTDVFGQPLIRLEVRTPRAISERGAGALRFASISLGLAGAVTLFLLLFLLRRTVFDPVGRLTRHAVAIGAGDELGARLDLRSKDEVGVLAREFDRMVERLAETRKRLLEQSYRSGVAEMASGVLHNIGNAITPVGVKLANLRGEIRQSPLGDMELARTMLQSPETPASQRAEVVQFLELAGQEVEALLRRAGDELAAVQAQVDHVLLILADQQRFSRAERVLEAVALPGLMEETVRLLPERVREGLVFEAEPGLEQIGPVQAARVALQQVLSNLLINAGEAVHARGDAAGPGRVQVRAREETLDGAPVVHLEIEDNGVGIPAENLPHLFERGFSTKNRGSGMGLHWSANTVNALQGRLYAESRGRGLGATLHLVLPMAGRGDGAMENAA